MPDVPMSVATMPPQSSTRPAREPCAEFSLPGIWPGRERLRPDFRIDRRRTPRWKLHGTATLLSLGVDLGRIAELGDLDSSPWWLAGRSQTPLTVGMRVSVGFSNPMYRPSVGRIMRCERQPCGAYRIAMRFEGALCC